MQLMMPASCGLDRSFDLNNGTFVRNDIAITNNGVYMQHSDRKFKINPEELQIKHRIGFGASSYVKLAVHVPTGTQLALKVINIFDKEKRVQMAEEIRSLYNTECDSIVNFYGAYCKEGAVTLALEYMDGGSLANVIHQVGRIPEKPLASIIFQVLWGLAYLKVEKRLHRDIKPSNILINNKGVVKLTDFGISRELKNSIAFSTTIVGTCKYMSPERVNGKPYGHGTDIWSLGLVTLECAIGSFPYATQNEAVSVISMLQLIVDNPSPSLPENSADAYFSDAMREFISITVSKNEKNRCPADILIGHPWFLQNGVTDLNSAIDNVHGWIESLQQG